MRSSSKRASFTALASVIATAVVAGPIVATAVAAAPGADSPVFINEFHYDNVNTDSGEFIEIAGPVGQSLSGWSIVLYNGGSSSSQAAAAIAYDTKALSGTIPDSHVVSFSYPQDGIQNGSPDGIALISPSGVAQFLSYEGVITAKDGAAAGQTSTDIGISETASTPLGSSLQLTGTSTSYAGFTWTAATATSGSLNTGQTWGAASSSTPPSSSAPASPPASSAPPTSPPPTDPPGGTTPTITAIADIQGTGAATPTVNATYTTQGVVTGDYDTGTSTFRGFTIQTPGADTTPNASDGIFVYFPASAGTVPTVNVGDFVQVTGQAQEFNGLTELSVSSASNFTKLDNTGKSAVAYTGAYPTTDAARERLESMLVNFTGTFTVTDNYDANAHGELGLAAGTTPLVTPTEVGKPGSAANAAQAADNAARGLRLDDGTGVNFTSTDKDVPLPYISATTPMTVGTQLAFQKPVILDYRNSGWVAQPTGGRVTGATAAADLPVKVTLSGRAKTAPEAVGGDVSLAGFNVLNYFTTLGTDLTGCRYYTDRAGNPITINDGCDARGAANAASFARQQGKIVAAINALGADVVSLEEIENSAKFNQNRDASLSKLVDALNAAAGSQVWAFVPTANLSQPAISEQDVIRNAFIYKKANVQPVGDATIYNPAGTPSGAFANAREPLAAAFKKVGAADASKFLVISNHFKSKGSGSGADADQGDGQGGSNASRVAQANALTAFSTQMQAKYGTQAAFLIGDFNAYSEEDPVRAIRAAGYTDLGAVRTNEYSYSFDGQEGSLDHVFANAAANAATIGADIWTINADETIAEEYSRFNYNVTNFFDGSSVYRSSDHDPIKVGISTSAIAAANGGGTTLNLININDFHGRIDSNTVKFAGTIEQLRAQYGEDASAFLSAGDNIGASLFASSVAQDEPTIDVLNALDLQASAVGNHEFDQGFSDLTGRVEQAAQWDYLGANVYKKGTQTPALPEYRIITINGVRVGIIGAVTQETPSLVSPGGVSSLDFGDPVDAVNRVANQLTDGVAGNGEADVLIAEYHEGAGAGTPDKATLEQEVAAGGAFAKIVNGTSAKVAAIFTGHTHKQYAWDGPVPGQAGKTRPILQTGNYGEFVGQVVLNLDASDQVVSYTQRNVARLTTDDATLVNRYQRVADVKTIVDAALKNADAVGSQPIGKVNADITTAYTDGSYVNGKWVATTRDDRASESTLGDLVADSLVESLKGSDRGGATIGVVNPGGLRAELLYGSDGGVVTYAEANAVLPFVNNLWTTTLTGAQFKQALEQQWQTNADGSVPSRPYLQLGLSKNVTYTYDPALAAGSRITSVTIDGKPLDPNAQYRIGSFNFLLQGGDNFRAFAQGTDTRDSGLVDRDAWIAFLKANATQGLSPDFARQAVQVKNLPTTVAAGGSVAFDVSKLDLTSLGSPANTTLQASLNGTSIGSPSPVTNGAASVTLTIPANAPANSVITLVAAASGTTVTIPVRVTASAGTGGGTDAGTGTGAGGQLPTLPIGAGGAGTRPSMNGSGTGGQLAYTGADLAGAGLAGGLLLLLAGAGVLGLRRRRSRAVSETAEG